MVDELNYEQNLGAILRSSMGAGVHGVIIPDVRGKGLTLAHSELRWEEVKRYHWFEKGLMPLNTSRKLWCDRYWCGYGWCAHLGFAAQRRCATLFLAVSQKVSLRRCEINVITLPQSHSTWDWNL